MEKTVAFAARLKEDDGDFFGALGDSCWKLIQAPSLAAISWRLYSCFVGCVQAGACNENFNRLRGTLPWQRHFRGTVEF